MKRAKLNNNKQNNKKEEVVQSNDVSVKKVVITLVSIIIVFVAFYFFTDYLIANRKAVTKPNDTDVKESNYISFNNIYKQKDKTYYVLAILDTDKNKEKYAIYANDMKPLYYIDMTEAFNKSHMGDVDVVTESVKDIVISDTTLFVIKENKLQSYHTGYENIKKYMISSLEKTTE
jgi:hypothetical protein